MVVRLNSYLLFAALISIYVGLINYVLAFVLLVVVFILLTTTQVKKRAFYSGLFFIPLIIGFIIGLNNNNTYNVFKDVYYFIIPLVLFTYGGLLASQLSLNRFFKIIVIVGVIVSIIKVVLSISSVGFSAIIDPYSARYSVSRMAGNPAPVLALFILLYSKKYGVALFQKSLFRLLVIINSLGIFMFASRTYYLLVVCFLFFLFLDRLKKIHIIPVLIISIFLVLVSPFGKGSSGSNNIFVNKIFNSFAEVSANKYQTGEDINNKFRGYETFMALEGFRKGSTANLFFGDVGKLVDIQTDVLGEGLSKIPKFHNGWVYILVKNGFFGVIFYIVLLVLFIKQSWKVYRSSLPPIHRLTPALLLGAITGLATTNYIVYSFFNLEMAAFLVFIGFIYVFGNTFLEQETNAGNVQ